MHLYYTSINSMGCLNKICTTAKFASLKPVVAIRNCFGKRLLRLVGLDIPVHHLAVESATSEHGKPRMPAAVTDHSAMVIQLMHKLRSQDI